MAIICRFESLTFLMSCLICGAKKSCYHMKKLLGFEMGSLLKFSRSKISRKFEKPGTEFRHRTICCRTIRCRTIRCRTIRCRTIRCLCLKIQFKRPNWKHSVFRLGYNRGKTDKIVLGFYYHLT